MEELEELAEHLADKVMAKEEADASRADEADERKAAERAKAEAATRRRRRAEQQAATAVELAAAQAAAVELATAQAELAVQLAVAERDAPPVVSPAMHRFAERGRGARGQEDVRAARNKPAHAVVELSTMAVHFTRGVLSVLRAMAAGS